VAKEIFLCAINNILSGNCSEDCAFCTQSVKHKAQISRYKVKPIEQIIQEAKEAKANGAVGYCLVTAGKGLDDKKTQIVAKIAYELKKELNNFNLIACNGTASLEQLKYLKEHGVDSYNHNLESSKEYYSKICTTHTWQERYNTVQNAKEAGLKVCSGGIFGMGESGEDRDSLIDSIASLNPHSIPINFFVPNPSLPITSTNISYKEALDIIKKVKEKIPNARIMVAGGREQLFTTTKEEQEMFNAGASSIVIGNYLTVKGLNPQTDRDRLKELGYKIATNCHAK
jgi:biotin synthase